MAASRVRAMLLFVWLVVATALARAPAAEANAYRLQKLELANELASELTSNEASAPAPAPTHLHDLEWRDGVLCMTQLRSEVSAEHRAMLEEGMETGVPLFAMTLNFDIESFDAAGGLTVMWDKQDHKLRIDEGKQDTEGIAWGKYVDKISGTGWSHLYMTTSGLDNFSNDVKMYAVGYIEGFLTAVRLSEYYANNHAQLLRAEANWGSLENIKAELEGHVKFMKKKTGLAPRTMAEEPSAPYWKLGRYFTFQMWGMQEGYNHMAKHFNVHKLSMLDFVFINEGSEMQTLFQAFQTDEISDRDAAQDSAGTVVLLQEKTHLETLLRASRKLRKFRDPDQKAYAIELLKKKLKEKARRELDKRWDRTVCSMQKDPAFCNKSSALQVGNQLDDKHWEARMAFDGRCSAFVRVKQGNGDLLAGHTTWGDYTSMTRVFKYYNFPLKGAKHWQMATNVGFSSYPGLISSGDEWYLLSSGLLVMDTSIEVMNEDIWVDVVDFTVSDVKTLPNFMHIQIVNRIAKTPMHWVDLFTSKNSGTMNNQWMILDYNNFVPGKPPPDNMFWVLETIPGKMHSADMTHRLRSHGFWGSYNRPYFQDIREATGHDDAQRKVGAVYSWADAPRATIFSSSAPGVNSAGDMRKLMNRNQYPTGGVEPQTPGHDISARFDLASDGPVPAGGIDAKVTCRCLMKALKCQAQSGPAHTDVRAFTWTKDDGRPYFPGYVHIGQPDVWSFDYVQVSPTGAGGVNDCD